MLLNFRVFRLPLPTCEIPPKAWDVVEYNILSRPDYIDGCLLRTSRLWNHQECSGAWWGPIPPKQSGHPWSRLSRSTLPKNNLTNLCASTLQLSEIRIAFYGSSKNPLNTGQLAQHCAYRKFLWRTRHSSKNKEKKPTLDHNWKFRNNSPLSRYRRGQ